MAFQLGEDVLVCGVEGRERWYSLLLLKLYSSVVRGLKELQAIIDVDEVFGDQNRANNSASRTIFVGDAPNSFFGEFVLSKIVRQMESDHG